MSHDDAARIVWEARRALSVLEHCTTDEFAHGGDRQARAALVAILDILGAATSDEKREYFVLGSSR